jgi:methyl-accepting chemotaxis protein
MSTAAAVLDREEADVQETQKRHLLQEEVLRVASALKQGRLSERAQVDHFEGGSRVVLENLNEMLDAVIEPLNVSAEYVDRISKGDIPPRITDHANGDFNEINNNLNACIDGLDGLIEANRVLQRMAMNDYSVKVEGSYPGVFGELAKATNGAQDRIKHALTVVEKIAAGDFQEELLAFQKVGKRSENDTLVPAFLRAMTAIEALVADADMLAKAAADGQVGKRADASKHQGDYRKIIEGMNRTLEAIVAPLKATTESASTLASSSEELTAVSQQMAGNAEETATQANVVSAASEQVSKNVASVASASEQMQSSIREISKNANESARVAKNAVSVAHSTNDTVKKLGESSQEIGNVIKVITSIAQQTNLLALNATIEAARAGEAGKGFAVVANEVKELAKQTAKATEEISQKIEAIQGDTKGAVHAIEEIGTIINQINDISNSIASAVEEQTATTAEIGHNVTEAAKGVGDIAKNIGGVALAAKNTTQGANDTQKASLELSHMAAQLQKVVSRFTF